MTRLSNRTAVIFDAVQKMIDTSSLTVIDVQNATIQLNSLKQEMEDLTTHNAKLDALVKGLGATLLTANKQIRELKNALDIALGHEEDDE